MGFSCSVKHLSGSLKKHMFTCMSSKGHGLWFVIGGFQSVLFVSAFNKMIDWTEKPKIPSKFAICAVQYNKFCCKPLVVFLYLHLSCFELSMKQLSVFSTLLGQAQVAMKIKTELNTGNNILQLYMNGMITFLSLIHFSKFYF